MGKKKRIVVFISILICISLLIWYRNIRIKTYKNDYIKIEYDKEWKKISSSNNNLILSKDNNSTIEINIQKIKDKTLKKDEVYLDLNQSFLKANPTYDLVNQETTRIGKDYYEANSFLYENSKQQALYIMIVKDNYLITINYLSITTKFDLNLEYFYQVMNSLEIR